MEQLLKSNRFKTALDKLENPKKDRVISLIKELIISRPELKVYVYIAILDKLFRKDVSYTDISAFSYIGSIQIWNDIIIDDAPKNLDLLIVGGVG